MQRYQYTARQSNGQIVRDEMLAEGPAELREQLRTVGLQIVSCRELEGPTRDPWLNLDQFTQFVGMLNRPAPRHVETALRQLAMLLRSGLDLLTALQTVSQQATSRSLAIQLDRLRTRISKGESLAGAMEASRAFPVIAVQLVNVGEQTGNLPPVLEQAARHLAQRRTLINEVRVALAYPVLVATAAISIAVYLILMVVPELQKFLGAMGRKLPRMTQSLVDIAQWCHVHGATTLTCIGFVVAAFVAMLLYPPTRLLIDRRFAHSAYRQHTPIVRHGFTCQFARRHGTQRRSVADCIECSHKTAGQSLSSGTIGRSQAGRSERSWSGSGVGWQ